jgi:hypothetical protein
MAMSAPLLIAVLGLKLSGNALEPAAQGDYMPYLDQYSGLVAGYTQGGFQTDLSLFFFFFLLLPLLPVSFSSPFLFFPPTPLHP